MKYLLKNKNTVIALFDTESVTVYDKDLYGAVVGKMDLMQFLKMRRAPSSRAYIQDLISKFGAEFLDVTLGLSLIDTIWVCPIDLDFDWDTVSFYRNEFPANIADYAFSGKGEINPSVITTSPEYATDGALPKCWIRKDDGIYLCKGSTAALGFSNAGFEPYAEFYAAQVAKQMNILPYTSYELEIHNGDLASTCPIFTSENVSYISMARYIKVHNTDVNHVIDDLNLMDAYNDLMFFDSVICNTDRHLGNFGIMVEADTYKPMGLSPIFDNGMSLAYLWVPDNKLDITEYANEMDHFTDIGKSLLNTKRKKCLERLEGLEIPRHPFYNWSDEKFEGMQRLLEFQRCSIL